MKLEGMGYADARKVILQFGWVPQPGSCGGGGAGDAACKAFPEIRNCSGVAPGYCDMAFSRPRRCLVVTTTGGRPHLERSGDTHVLDVSFQKGECRPDSD